jgi:hypothetical protein
MVDRKTLDELERLEKAATPGPWLLQDEESGNVSIWERDTNIGTLATVFPDDINGEYPARANADLIAAMRNALPALIATAREVEDYAMAAKAERHRAEAAEARIKVLEEALTRHADMVMDLFVRLGGVLEKPHWLSTELACIQSSLRDAALSPAQDTAPVYLHKKRGTTYTLVGEATLQVTEAAHDNARLVIYRSTTDGRLWVRPYHEFHDGRFEAQDTAQPAAQDKPETVEPCGAVLDLCRIWPGCDLPGCTIRGTGREDTSHHGWTMNDILDFRPQIASMEAGPEPSLRWMLRDYYMARNPDADWADNCAREFIAALDAHRAAALAKLERAATS